MSADGMSADGMSADGMSADGMATRGTGPAGAGPNGAGPGGAGRGPAETAGQATARWWRRAAIYQVYVRSFADSDGDGIGDLAGILQRLPYLRELGVDAVWITPFYPSPMVDGGYDVTDYRDVDPMFGTLDDARALVDGAHRHGLRVIVDLVPNHTSDRHPWFRAALAGSAADRDRYVFRPGRGERGELPPNDWESVFGGSAWTRTLDADGEPGDWYLHLFDARQPDLDWRNPAVRDEFSEILRFWLDLGVDGFRVDVAHGMVKAEGLPDVGRTGQGGLIGTGVLPYFDQDGVHEIYREWRKILDSYPGERIGVAEAWAPTVERLARYVRPDELHQVFNFHFLSAPWSAAALRDVIERSLATAGSVGAPATWVLANHDVQRAVTRFSGGRAGLRRARAAALLMLALPGSAYLYQGDELGLDEVLDLPDDARQDPIWRRSGYTERGRDGCRVPMPWEGTGQPFGFSPPGAARPWLPQPQRWRALTVSAQLADPNSTLALYRSALRLRREDHELREGELRWLSGLPRRVLGFTRGTGFACTVNTGGRSVTIDAPGVPLLTSRPLPAGQPPRTEDRDRPRETTRAEVPVGQVRIPPDTAVWWRVG